MTEIYDSEEKFCNKQFSIFNLRMKKILEKNLTGA